jgi:hypothetical protein
VWFFEDIGDSNNGDNDNDSGGNGCIGGGHGNNPTRYRGKRKVGDTQQST